MKPVAVFVSTDEKINNAYNTKTKESLFSKLDFLPGVYGREEIINGRCKDAEYIFSTWGMAKLSEEEIAEYLPKLKAVFYAAGTVRYFALPFLNRGVRIFSAWGANAVPVAETVVSEIILADKGFFHTLHNGSGDNWNEHDNGNPHPGNFNTPVGIIGAGMIGTLVIKMLASYKLDIKVFDPFMSEEKAAALNVSKVSSLEELFASCHVVSNHLADNEQTRGMITSSCFDKMADNGVFINTGRGRQVVESDMIKALKEKPSRCAVLDVTFPEPPEKGSELYKMPNVFLTPHLAGSIGNEIQRMGEYMYDEFSAFVENRAVKYEVTEKMLETMA